MIHNIFSELESFKRLEFHSGLNILLAKKEVGATDRQTRNRAGKSSLIEIVNFLLGAKVDNKSIFRLSALKDKFFGMSFDCGEERITVRRSGKPRSKIRVSYEEREDAEYSNNEWKVLLGNELFGLDSINEYDGSKPSFRMLFSYFARRQSETAFQEPKKAGRAPGAEAYQIAIMYLLGLDWKIASGWKKVRDQEKGIKQLKKSAGDGTLGRIIGRSSDLRTQLTISEERLNRLRREMESFNVLEEYHELEAEANQITERQSEISDKNTIDLALIEDIEKSLQTETPPSFQKLEEIYREAGIILPENIVRRYEDVKLFHESIIRNRKHYLSEELMNARQRIENRKREREGLERRKSEIMKILQSHGALDQYIRLQGELGKKQAEVESLRERFLIAEKIERSKTELEIERNRLKQRLERDFEEQEERLKEAILAYEEISKRLYEDAGKMAITSTKNGPELEFIIQGSRSKGINNMQIFCFDLMLMQLCAKRGIGPGFLIHDSHLFDGVDGRQVISALEIGAKTAEKLGFQYIVTMNEDDAFKETTPGFDLKQYVLPVYLTDATEDGGLFGFRF